MQQVRQPHFTKPVVVLVERQAVEPKPDAAPRRSISATGARPERMLRLELLLTDMVAPRAPISSSSSGRAHVQCASVRRG